MFKDVGWEKKASVLFPRKELLVIMKTIKILMLIDKFYVTF